MPTADQGFILVNDTGHDWNCRDLRYQHPEDVLSPLARPDDLIFKPQDIVEIPFAQYSKKTTLPDGQIQVIQYIETTKFSVLYTGDVAEFILEQFCLECTLLTHKLNEVIEVKLSDLIIMASKSGLREDAQKRLKDSGVVNLKSSYTGRTWQQLSYSRVQLLIGVDEV